MKVNNPFRISGYISPKYFCDREKETESLKSALLNQRNITLFSHRRMGKTGLIHHVFYQLQKEKQVSCFYLDIMATANLNDFINQFGRAVLGKVNSRPGQMMHRIGQFFAHLRPVISYDPLDGSPVVKFNTVTEGDARAALEQIFSYLEKQHKHVIIAIDEFQQILNYPEKNVEALLRFFVQEAPNVNFVFSGSHQHLLMSIFGAHSRPFYQSTELMHLGPVEEEAYIKFIQKNIKAGGKTIAREDVLYLLDLTKRHTYYVQYLCNKLYAVFPVELTQDVINKTFINILKENEALYYNYRNLLSEQQWKLLEAIAKEDKVEQPTAQGFIKKYDLNTPSTVKTALTALEQKEMIYEEGGAYQVYDVFLSRWLRRY